ncbi:hypothetical protein SLA2020_233650 [Shorea laevis]
MFLDGFKGVIEAAFKMNLQDRPFGAFINFVEGHELNQFPAPCCCNSCPLRPCVPIEQGPLGPKWVIRPKNEFKMYSFKVGSISGLGRIVSSL